MAQRARRQQQAVPLKDPLTADQAAEECFTTGTTVRKWIKNRELEAIVISATADSDKPRYLIRRAALDAFLEKRRTTNLPPRHKKRRVKSRL